MVRFALILMLLGLGAIGCCQKPGGEQAGNAENAPAIEVAASGSQFQVRLGGSRSEEDGRLDFEILKIYVDRKPINAIPWHAAGGDWTYFDCRTALPNRAAFTIGIRNTPRQGLPVIFSDASIVVANPGEGVQLIEALSKGFHEPPPKIRDPQPLEHWKFKVAMLAEEASREPTGRFQSGEGSWTAAKWFLERDGRYAEVYFNYSLKERKGEFREKDPDDRKKLLAVLAAVVRDGPRPERSPQNDPNLTAVGPTFAKAQLLAKKTEFAQFSPGGKNIVFSTQAPDGSTAIMAAAPKQWDAPIELTRVQHVLDRAVCVDDEMNQLLVLERIPTDKRIYSSEDPKQLWWIDRNRNERRKLAGPWQDKSTDLPDDAVSPGGRLVLIKEWRNRTDGKPGSYLVFHIFDRETNATRTIERVNQSLEFLGWAGAGKDLRPAFLWREGRGKLEERAYFLGDPFTGDLASVKEATLPLDRWNRRVSSDGEFKAEVERMGELTIEHVKTGEKRSFLFHEEDSPFVRDAMHRWVNPRYLLLDLNRPAFLDVQTMKMNYPLGKKVEVQGLVLSPDFQWALWQDKEDALYFSAVVMPPDPSRP